MARGSSFWSTSRGKLGNMVLSVVRGQQVERAYQPKVLNPKTRRQMTQRATFASFVKLYKLLNSGLFRFGYEDKGKRESDYNAFMRHSLKYGYAANKKPTQRTDIWPLECYLPVLSYGSLREARNPEDFSFSEVEGTSGLWLETGMTDLMTKTFGALSYSLISRYDLQDGDYVTMVYVVTDTPKDRSSLIKLYTQADAGLLKPTYTNTIRIKQFKLDTTSTEKAGEVLESKGFSFGGEGNGNLGFNIPLATLQKYCCYATFIFSRKVEGQSLLVSTSKLYPNVDEPDTIFADSERLNTILASWGASEDAILEGSIANYEESDE